MWCAHCVHLSADDIADFAASKTGVAHCPTSNLRLGAGVAPVRDYLDAGIRVGLGVDGSASNERSDLLNEVKQALLVARGRGGPRAMTAREALRLGHARRRSRPRPRRHRLARAREARRLRVWRTDGLELGGADDPVAGLVFSAPHRVDRLVVEGEDVVRGGALVHADEDEIARAHRAAGAKIRRMSVSVSTHVLDTASGKPAARGARRAGAAARGRSRRARPTPTAASPSSPRDLEPGRYELVFWPPSPFFTRVELEVELDDGHHHIPLLVSPYGCASYRGS